MGSYRRQKPFRIVQKDAFKEGYSFHQVSIDYISKVNCYLIWKTSKEIIIGVHLFVNPVFQNQVKLVENLIREAMLLLKANKGI